MIKIISASQSVTVGIGSLSSSHFYFVILPGGQLLKHDLDCHFDCHCNGDDYYLYNHFSLPGLPNHHRHYDYNDDDDDDHDYHYDDDDYNHCDEDDNPGQFW